MGIVVTVRGAGVVSGAVSAGSGAFLLGEGFSALTAAAVAVDVAIPGSES
jgi:hypothetical protein